MVKVDKDSLASYWESPFIGDFRRIYHVSPSVLNQSIEHHGIDPVFANGFLKVSWYCEKPALLWALAHISALKSISVDQLTVHSASVWKGALARSKSAGVFTCRYVVVPAHSYPANHVFSWFHPDGTVNNG